MQREEWTIVGGWGDFSDYGVHGRCSTRREDSVGLERLQRPWAPSKEREECERQWGPGRLQKPQ